jgi:hypothetical protein
MLPQGPPEREDAARGEKGKFTVSTASVNVSRIL